MVCQICVCVCVCTCVRVCQWDASPEAVPFTKLLLGPLQDLSALHVDLSWAVEQAFGEEGLGILAVTGVPNLDILRRRVLGHAWRLAQLPGEKLSQLEVPPFYQRGWSCGQEKMQDGRPDFSKGSFYFNPVCEAFAHMEDDLKRTYPTFYGDNVWPTAVLGEEFRVDVLACATTMVNVGKLLAAHCDKFVRSRIADWEHSLADVVETSQHHAGRLLHYFAPSSVGSAEGPEDDWCGWHNDHGTLTALLPAAYHSSAGATVESPDPKAGLYIRTRRGELVHARAPPGTLLFQIGESAQIHTGGLLKATPHMVRSVQSVAGVSRSTLAIFMEPGPDYPMSVPPTRNPSAALACAHLPRGVPALSTRWHPGINMGDYSNRTFAAYYPSA